MQVRAERGLLCQEVIYPPYQDLEVPHSSKRHRPSLAEGSDGMCLEIVESIRHADQRLCCSFVLVGASVPFRDPSEDRSLRVNPRESIESAGPAPLSEPAHVVRLDSRST